MSLTEFSPNTDPADLGKQSSIYGVNRGLTAQFRLDSTESAEVLGDEVVRQALQQHPRLALYPTNDAVESLIARQFGLTPREVMLTAGADDGLERIIRTYARKGKVKVHLPTFEMILRYCQENGATLDAVEWWEGPFPCEAFRPEDETTLIVIVSPNNPTGVSLTLREIETVVKNANGTPVLLDLAYVDFADRDPTTLLQTYRNLIITRTFSKGWGLPGLRIGYVLSHEENLAPLRAVSRPYCVSSPALAVVEYALRACQDLFRANIQRIRTGRPRLATLLNRAGAKVWPSQANFLLAEFADSAQIFATLTAGGVAVRDFPNRPELRRVLRINVPWEEAQWERLETLLCPKPTGAKK